MWGKHTIEFQRKKLNPGERVIMSLEGLRDGDSLRGELILTDQRLCFYRKGILGEKFETIPLKMISSVETKGMLGIRYIKAYTSHDSLEFQSLFDKESYLEFCEKLEKHRRQSVEAAVPAASSPAKSSASVADELAKLAVLKDQGVLSESEFAEQKKRLLA